MVGIVAELRGQVASVESKLQRLHGALEQVMRAMENMLNIVKTDVNNSSVVTTPTTPSKSPVVWSISSATVPASNVNCSSYSHQAEDSTFHAVPASGDASVGCPSWQENSEVKSLTWIGQNNPHQMDLIAPSANEIADNKLLKRILLMSGSTLRAREIKNSGPFPLRKMTTEAIKAMLTQLAMMGFGLMQTPQLFTKKPPAEMSDEQCALLGIEKALYQAAYMRPIHSGTQKYIQHMMSVHQSSGAVREENLLVNLE